MNEDNDDYNQETVVNQPNMMSESAMIFRLNPEVVLREIEAQLRGYYLETIWDETKGERNIKKVAVGVRLLNDAGVQAIMTKLRSIINHMNVLGVFPNDQEYFDFLYNLNNDISELLYVNHDDYELDVKHYSAIIDVVMYFSRLFLSRLRGKGERPWLTAIKENFTTISGKKKGVMPNFQFK